MRTLAGNSLGKREPHAFGVNFHAVQAQSRRRRLHAFSLLELMIVLSIVGILVALLIPASIKAKAKSKRIGCVRNLGLLGLSFRTFATDHGDRFPWEINPNLTIRSYDAFLGHLTSVSNQFTAPSILACPSDNRKPAANWSSLSNTNISYFFGLSTSETYPQSILAGDRNLMTNGVRLPMGIVALSTNLETSWDIYMHHRQGNTVMGDGSVQQLSAARLREQFKNGGVSEIKLAIP